MRHLPARPARTALHVVAAAAVVAVAATGASAATATAAPAAPAAASSRTAAAGPTVGLGARGLEVRGVQTRLNQWFAFHPRAGEAVISLRVDGVFGPTTAAAVRAFQRRNGLAVDGVAGPRTRSALGLSAPLLQGLPTSTLRLGSRGAQVVTWQHRLDQLPSGARVRADGVFGPRTVAATRAFQRRAGLAPDGVVGPRTRAAMAEQALDV